MTNGVNGMVSSETVYSIAGEKKVPLEVRNVPYCEHPHIPLWAQGYFFENRKFSKIRP